MNRRDKRRAKQEAGRGQRRAARAAEQKRKRAYFRQQTLARQALMEMRRAGREPIGYVRGGRVLVA